MGFSSQRIVIVDMILSMESQLVTKA